MKGAVTSASWMRRPARIRLGEKGKPFHCEYPNADMKPA
jgi:hypothetical protein